MRAFRFIPLIVALVASTALAERLVLKVNDDQLTDTDLRLAQQLVALQMQRENPGAQVSQDTVMSRIVDRLIRQTLLLQAAHEAEVTVHPDEVAADVSQQRTRRGAAAFEKYLADLGLTEKEFTRRVGDQMVIRKFVDTMVASRITVTDSEARTFYDSNSAKFEHPEEVRLRTILLKLDPSADEKQVAAVKDHAELARKQLVLGEDMAAVAKDVSDDPSKARGGDLGWVRKGMLLPELEPAVWALKPGELSEVLKSTLGYHLFKAEGRRMPGKVSFDEVKSTLTDTIKNEKLVAAMEALTKERRAKAKIEAFDPVVKATLETLQAQLAARPPISGKPATEPAPGAPKRP